MAAIKKVEDKIRFRVDALKQRGHTMKRIQRDRKYRQLRAQLSIARLRATAGPRLVTLWARVEKPKFWGEVSRGAKSYDVVPEPIVLVVDRIDLPRDRFKHPDEKKVFNLGRKKIDD